MDLQSNIKFVKKAIIEIGFAEYLAINLHIPEKNILFYIDQFEKDHSDIDYINNILTLVQ